MESYYKKGDLMAEQVRSSFPRVSVVVPVYNNAATLPRTLDSLAAQDYANFHVVVVDDCSSDDSVAIAQQYAAKYPFISSIKNEHNLGLVGNYSLGYRFIEGEFAMLGGPDDTWSPNFLSTMIAEFEKHPEAAAGLSSVTSLFDDGEFTIYHFPELDRLRRYPLKMAHVVLNGVGRASGRNIDLYGTDTPYNSLIHAVVKSKYFRAIYPNNESFWHNELQIVAMQVLLGGVVTVPEALYTRHRFRKSWSERYPDDQHVASREKLRTRIGSAFSFLSQARSCVLIPAQNRKYVPAVFFTSLAYQAFRPSVAVLLRRLLPMKVFAGVRRVFYSVFASDR